MPPVPNAAASGALARLAGCKPDLLLLGVGLAVMRDLDRVRQLRSSLGASSVAAMMLFPAPEAESVLRAAGADAVVSKGSAVDALPALLTAVSTAVSHGG